MARKKKRDIVWKIFVGIMLLSLLLTPILILLSIVTGSETPYGISATPSF